MPYVSGAQRGWAHTSAGMKALGGPGKVAEWDSASKGKTLPAHVKPKHPVDHIRRRGEMKHGQ